MSSDDLEERIAIKLIMADDVYKGDELKAHRDAEKEMKEERRQAMKSGGYEQKEMWILCRG